MFCVRVRPNVDCVCMRVYMCRVSNLFCSYAFVLTDVVFLLPFQNELCAATQSLAQQLRAYEIQVRHCTDIRSRHSTSLLLHIVDDVTSVTQLL